MRLANKIAIVTGGARGVGRAIAERFAAEGATVYAADIAPGDYEMARVHHVQLDIGKLEDWGRLAADVVAREGRIDVLVNNASIVRTFAPLHEVEASDWQAIVDTNLGGTFFGIKTVAPIMCEQESGSIVNVASTVALTGTPSMAAYASSKGGVRSLSRNCAITYAAKGVRANVVVPGVVDTELLAQAGPDALAAVVAMTPLGRVATTAEVANCVLFLASDEASYVTGAELVVDGGFVAA